MMEARRLVVGITKHTKEGQDLCGAQAEKEGIAERVGLRKYSQLHERDGHGSPVGNALKSSILISIIAP